MDGQSLICTTLIVFLSVCVGCNNSLQPANRQISTTPEEVYRNFMIANLSGDESTIRPLVLEHKDAHVLWQGAYPTEVAALLSEQYRTMEISRVDSPNSDETNRVVLQSSAVPMTVAVVNLNGDWKVDAGPIIEFRKQAENVKQ